MSTRNGPIRALVMIIVAAVAAFAYEQHALRGSVRVDGTIVSMRPARFGGGPTGDPYRLLIEYDLDGASHRFESGRSVFEQVSGDFEPGHHVPVVVTPGDPASARIGTMYHVHTASLSLGVVAGMLAVVVGWMTVTGRLKDVAG